MGFEPTTLGATDAPRGDGEVVFNDFWASEEAFLYDSNAIVQRIVQSTNPQSCRSA
jgi:hypothetical protein